MRYKYTRLFGTERNTGMVRTAYNTESQRTTKFTQTYILEIEKQNSFSNERIKS